MRWIVVTRKLDPADAMVGFVMRWVEGLAARLDHLDVICQETVAPPLPPNVTAHSMGKEAGAGRAAQARHFITLLRRLVPRADGVFCHMIPRYVLFAAPWCQLYRKPLLFWYTHRQVSLELRLAHPLPTRILTAAPGSYPLPTRRLAVMGHGIDPAQFVPGEEIAPPEVVLVARLARIKRQDWLLRAASQAVRRGAGPFRVRLIGGPVAEEPGYGAELAALARELDPAPPVLFDGPLPHARVSDAVRTCAVAVNLSPPGLFDKAALESMLAAKPTLVTNRDFLPLLGEAADLLTLPEDADDAALADRLVRLLALGPAERQALGQRLRERTLAAHALPGLMDRLTQVMREAAHG